MLLSETLLHWLHWKGFSPVCILWWTTRCCCCMKLLLHWVHWKGFSPVCTLSWTRVLLPCESLATMTILEFLFRNFCLTWKIWLNFGYFKMIHNLLYFLYWVSWSRCLASSYPDGINWLCPFEGNIAALLSRMYVLLVLYWILLVVVVILVFNNWLLSLEWGNWIK